jgi:fermentation-respiration switch protein FrsA (DUF1100 family)
MREFVREIFVTIIFQIKTMKLFYSFALAVCAFIANAQPAKPMESDIAINPLIKGTLFTPVNPGKDTPLVVLIAGSGPTNRSGNQVGMINNSLRFLAQQLASDGIAVFSYDKRIIAQMIAGNLDEGSLRFDDFIHDADDVVAYFRSEKKYAKIVIAGHSEGSLIGMMAAQKDADGYVSIAGAGRKIGDVLSEQIARQMPAAKVEAQGYIASLEKGDTVACANPMLQSLFRSSVQPYLISWMKLDPQDEIRKLHVPVLLVNGTKDLQVPQSDAELLHKARPDAKLSIIENMNHVFKNVEGGDAANFATYNNPDLPVKPELVTVVKQFVKSI